MTLREQASALLTDSALIDAVVGAEEVTGFVDCDVLSAAILGALQPLFDQMARNAEQCVSTATKCLDLEGERDDLLEKLRVTVEAGNASIACVADLRAQLTQAEQERGSAVHELSLIEADTRRGVTDCSTPVFQCVRNIVERLDLVEAKLTQAGALSADTGNMITPAEGPTPAPGDVPVTGKMFGSLAATAKQVTPDHVPDVGNMIAPPDDTVAATCATCKWWAGKPDQTWPDTCSNPNMRYTVSVQVFGDATYEKEIDTPPTFHCGWHEGLRPDALLAETTEP